MTDKLTLDAWPMSTRTPETKLTVDGEFTRIGNLEPHSITFHSNARPVLTIRPSGKIELGEDADPTEAAAQCIEAMGAALTGMIDNAVKAEREAQAAEIKRLREAIKRQAAAVRTLHHNEQTEINVLRRKSADAHRAVATLDSEREMNAVLTEELEAQAAELIEQARIIGMGAERELALRAEIKRLIPMVKDALEKGRHRLLKEGFSPQDPTVRAMNEAIHALAQQEPTP